MKTKEGIEYAQKMEALATARTTEEAMRAMTAFDPSGVSQVVNAYAHRVCNN